VKLLHQLRHGLLTPLFRNGKDGTRVSVEVPLDFFGEDFYLDRVPLYFPDVL
jgi:hypothetical protein